MPFSALRTYSFQVYVPTALVRTGEGMLVAALPLWLLSEGFSESLASVVLAAGGAGAVVAVLPFGSLISRRPVRDVTRWVGLVTAAALLFIAAAPASAAILVLPRMLSGGGQIAWLKGQETYLYRRLDPARRGRSMAALAATNRAAFLLGPVLGGGIEAFAGYDGVFIGAGLVVLVGTAVMLLAPAIPAVRMERSGEKSPATMRAVMKQHKGILSVLGAGQLCVGTLRIGFLTLVAFRGDTLGLSASEVGAVFSVAFLFDLVLFPVAGRIMDLRGRLHSIVPAFCLLSIATAAVPSASSWGTLMAVGALGGFANGLSTGTLLTLNSDLAPSQAPGQFIAAVGFLGSSGEMLGPLVAGTVSDSFSPPVAAVAIAAVGALGVALFWFGVGETRHLASEKT